MRPVALAAVPANGENELLAVKATRGGKNPCVDELTSNFAEALGVVVPIPVWEKALNDTNKRKTNFLILFFLCWRCCRSRSYYYAI